MILRAHVYALLLALASCSSYQCGRYEYSTCEMLVFNELTGHWDHERYPCKICRDEDQEPKTVSHHRGSWLGPGFR